MKKKHLILFVLLTNVVCLAADPQPVYEREDVPLTAKISSFFWSTGGAVIATGAVVAKCAPLSGNMDFSDLMITGAIGATSLFTTSLTFAYVGKNIGRWADPLVQYCRQHNSFFMYMTNKVTESWNASVYYANQGYYLHNHLRRSYFQGTLYEDKTVEYSSPETKD